MSEFVINPLRKEELSKFIDDKAKSIIKYFIIKSLFSQPESKTNQSQLPVQIPKEHIEQWFTQALNVSPVGAGSYPIDIYNERERWGADIKMLNMKLDKNGEPKNDSSGEASLGQNFSSAGIDLDNLFNEYKYEEIKDKWLLLLNKKFNKVKIEYPDIEKIYFFFLLRPQVQEEHTNFYFTGAYLDLEKLNDVTVNLVRTIGQSVFLDKFISDEYGNAKIYKAKKRLELRLLPKKWVDTDCAIKIQTSFSPYNINLRERTVDANFLREEIERLLNIEVKFSD